MKRTPSTEANEDTSQAGEGPATQVMRSAGGAALIRHRKTPPRGGNKIATLAVASRRAAFLEMAS